MARFIFINSPLIEIVMEKSPHKTPKPVVLCILDGWGFSHETEDNAIYEANTPFWDKLMAECPHSLLATSGEAVGLSDGQMGNSEVGHMNIGSGRIVMQNLPRIDKSLDSGEFPSLAEVREFIIRLKKTGGACHMLGLLSPGGVHSHQTHMAKIARIIAAENIDVKIHAFLDGRDTPPKSATEYLKKFESDVSGFDNIQISTVSGRYYAMDRDNRWDRVELAYNAIISANAAKFDSAYTAISNSYEAGKNDEFVIPCVIGNFSGAQDGDGLFMANFRSDRARQTLTALLDPDFKGFKRDKIVKFSACVGLVPYSSELNKFIKTIFEPQTLTNIFGKVLENNGLNQLRIAETEKYAHVTFFFNGGEEEKFKGEDRVMIPSPDVATYDLKPQMSAFEVTDNLLSAIESKKYDVIIVNYANTDMVGHTGIKSAAIAAVEAIDKCLSRLVPSVESADGVIFITADHGNAEQMSDESGKPHTSHTTGPVPFIVAGMGGSEVKLKDGKLCDIAPTLLDVLNITKPEEMTGESRLA